MTLSRRRFLAAGGAATVMAGLTACAKDRAAAADTVPVSVPVSVPRGGHIVVVGAGFAGIGAAERLLAAGYSVDVVDARARAGGRAHSVSLGGFPADLGANWLRLGDNALLPVAEELGLIGGATDFGTVTAIHGGRRHPVSTGDLYDRVRVPASYRDYEANDRNGDPSGGRAPLPSMAALLDGRLPVDSVAGCVARRLIESEYATELGTLSGSIWFKEDPDTGSSGPAEPTVAGGMQALLDALIRRAKPSLGERVLAVRRVADGVVVTTDRRTIPADAAIITASIGVLKSGAIALEPGLPAGHRRALDAMDMGSFTKLWIRYPSVTWPAGTTMTVLCDTPALLAIVDFSRSHGAPVFMGYAVGRHGRDWEGFSDEEAQGLFHRALQDQLSLSLPEPTGFTMSRWSRDPFVGGAYMYPNSLYRHGDTVTLRQPVAGRILLAGEALAEPSGYVDTAWRDGRRAADLLIG